jgi:hypothetical protein
MILYHANAVGQMPSSNISVQAESSCHKNKKAMIYCL